MSHVALPDDLNTFPKLIRRNARDLANRPAYREKEYGIWQGWTWAEAWEEILDLAAGCRRWGSGRGIIWR